MSCNIVFLQNLRLMIQHHCSFLNVYYEGFCVPFCLIRRAFKPIQSFAWCQHTIFHIMRLCLWNTAIYQGYCWRLYITNSTIYVSRSYVSAHHLRRFAVSLHLFIKMSPQKCIFIFVLPRNISCLVFFAEIWIRSLQAQIHNFLLLLLLTLYKKKVFYLWNVIFHFLMHSYVLENHKDGLTIFIKMSVCKSVSLFVYKRWL